VVVLRGGDLFSVESFALDGLELLERPDPLPPAYRIHGQRAGITLLHPWANRIGHDTFTVAGHEARVDETTAPERITRDGHGLIIHGILPRRPWQLERTGEASAAAHLDWGAEPAFPFAHRVEVRVELNSASEAGMTLSLDTVVSVTGTGEVPVSFGWHPYFRRRDGAVVHLPARSRLQADDRGLPRAELPREPAATIPLDGVDWDFGVTGLDPGATMTLTDSLHRVTVRFQAGYPHGQIFAPSDAPVLSLEPMTALTDALERGTCPLISSGTSYRASSAVDVARVGR
jgi:aldose 1-epimerase